MLSCCGGDASRVSFATFLVLSVLESYYWLDFNPRNNWLGLKASVQLLAFGVIPLLLTKQISRNYRSTKITRIIEWLGVQPMPVYMSHMLVKSSLKDIGFAVDSWIVYWFVVLSIDVILIIVLTKFLPKRILPYWGIR